MIVKPSDFASREEALAYANTRLDEWKEKFREIEKDIVSLSESPVLDEVRRIALKWEQRTAEKIPETET